MAGISTFVEYDILRLDAERGIFYQNFDAFWEQRMEPMQFIPREAKGLLATLRQTLRDRAEEQWVLFASQPQAGELHTLSERDREFLGEVPL